MRYEEKEVISVTSLIDKLDAHKKNGEILWFRGQDDIKWNLIPSIARNNTDPINREWALYKRFRQNATRFLENKNLSNWEWMFLMQHYSVPTRLLDWSESPLIALFFSVENSEADDKDGALWIISPSDYNKSIGFTSLYRNDMPCFELDKDLDAYLIDEVLKNQTASLNPIAAIASRNSSRIVAQHGVFTIFHSDFAPLEITGDNSIWRYKIPHGSKETIRKELNLLGINKLSLFPELGNVGDCVKELIL